MPVSMQIDLVDHATPAMAALKAEFSKPGVPETAGGAVRRLLMDHLQGLDQSRPNALGGARTHFYSDAARSVTYEADATSATVGVHKLGLALRRFGGTVRPVNSKWLTIPAIAEAHGRRAREFNNLEVLWAGAWGQSRPIGLVERASTDISFRKDRRKAHRGETILEKGKERGGRIFYWLVKSCEHQPDESVLPTEDLIASAAKFAILRFIASAAKFAFISARYGHGR